MRDGHQLTAKSHLRFPGVYSIKRFFAQEPAQVVTILSLLLTALITSGAVSFTDNELSVWTSFALAVLNGAYVRQLTVTKSGLDELAKREE